MPLDLLMIGEAAAAPAGGGLIGILPMILIFGFMLFWLFRTQKKEARKRQDMIDSVKAGDKVVTAGGIHGTIATVKEKTFLVKIAENIKIEVSKTGISAVLDAAAENSETAEKK
jgi:preprotein translocase subunit YajC